uniref:Uncharacterized protein n=1 Tax=Anguilla anguilla TaxID=7936 RepID=A0A0E9S1P7_ANGAN
MQTNMDNEGNGGQLIWQPKSVQELKFRTFDTIPNVTGTLSIFSVDVRLHGNLCLL